MSDSYGGVQNVWYVSPALFPLLVGGLLLLLSVVLIANAITYHGWPGVLRERDRGVSLTHESNQRFFAIVLLIATYVYAFIPHVDFFIATVLFLFAFITAFYLERHEPLVISTLAFFLLGIVVLISSRIAESGISHAFMDIVTTLVFIVLCLSYLRFCRRHNLELRRFRISLVVALAVPLILAPAFRFGLLVPLPTEGIFVAAMEKAKYQIRTMLQ